MGRAEGGDAGRGGIPLFLTVHTGQLDKQHTHVHYLSIHVHFSPINMWQCPFGCSVVSRGVECPPAASPFFTPSFVTEAFVPLPSTAPQFWRFPLLVRS